MENLDSAHKIIFVMGVSGSGKTSIGQLLARNLSVDFIDADDHHPPSNIDKMSSGVPLDDSDRLPWLNSINQIARDKSMSGCVIACSALKQDYRIRLSRSLKPNNVLWIYLKGSYDQIFERMNNRKGHFMGAEMLRSQFDTLEEPNEAIEIDIENPPETILRIIKTHLE